MSNVTARDIANYFLFLDEFEESSEGISNLKMQKLLYYAFGFYAATYDEFLFQDDIAAWPYGPVVPELCEYYQQYKKDHIPFPSEVKSYDEIDTLSPQQEQLVKDIFDEFGQYSAWKLKDMTHEEAPWMKYFRRENPVIPPEELMAYFKTRL